MGLPIGVGGFPAGIAGPPSGGFGGGPPIGIGGPALGIGNGIGRIGLPPGVQRARSSLSHLSQIPGQAEQALSHLRDEVGRPKDPVLLSRALAHDGQGHEIVRGELIAVSPNRADLAVARRLHFTILRRHRLSALGLLSVTLRVPRNMSAISALALLRRTDPSGNFDYSSIYNPSGDGQGPGGPTSRLAVLPAANVTLGMIDGGIGTHHPALAGSRISVRSFAGDGASPPTRHGTAIASLLIGRGRGFSGYLPGASLYAADVFGGAADGGSASDIARALNWLAANNIAVTNISLSGPPNELLAAAVKAFTDTGHVLVAAAGNNGPAAPPNYPAAYPGVICVTSVDASRRFQLDANRNHCGFAALGVHVRAARFPRGYASFTGTSYAAPVVTARFGRLMPQPDLPDVLTIRSKLMRTARHITATNGTLFYLVAAQVASRGSTAN
ncbi:MAG: S8 family serine peptidase [Alphaproteobacteria bacterium]|nr:S8 family serine peptidase [Alphaproteobacteria bacterium]